MDAFDADVPIRTVQLKPGTAAIREHFLGAAGGAPIGIGSVLLLPEVLSHPLLHGNSDEYAELEDYLGHLVLAPVDTPTSRLSVALRAKYRLKTVDATHLATAIIMDATRFVTNNRRGFRGVREIEIVGPEEF